MNARKLDAPFRMDLPNSETDRPSWVRVGAIAALGFIIGVAWPKLAGVRLGPSAPGEAAPATSAPSRAMDTVPAPAAPSQAVAPAAMLASSTRVPSPAPVVTSGPVTVSVNHGVTLTCKTEDGETRKGKACGAAIAFDALALPRLKKLSQCQAADGAAGKLSTIFNVDFVNDKVDVFVGRSSTVGNLDTIAGCLRGSFQTVSLGPIEHEHPRYQIAYNVNLSPRGVAPPAAPSGSPTSPRVKEEPSDSPSAQVVWEVAIVRDTPRTGQIIARLQRGTKIHVGSGEEGWYRVKYGATFSDEGWVYRGAIGR